MDSETRILQGAQHLAVSARAYGLALRRTPADQQVALDDLEASALALSSATGAVQGFASGGAYGNTASLEAQLISTAADLSAAEVLLAAGVAAAEVDVAPGVGREQLLDSSIERLEVFLDSERRTASRTSGLVGTDPAVASSGTSEDLDDAAREVIDGVVDGTGSVLIEAWERLKGMAPDVVTKALRGFADVVDAAPGVGRLVRLGLQLVKRCLTALTDLLPSGARDLAERLAGEWWTEHGADVRRDVVSRLTGAHTVRAAFDADQAPSGDPARLSRARVELKELAERFEGVASGLRAVVRALAGAVAVAAVIAAVVAAVAGWLPLAAAAGYLAAAGAAVVIARDYLDTGGFFARVKGVQCILDDAALP